MQSNEPYDIELSLFYKKLMRKIIFQHKFATDPMGNRNPEREGINMLYRKLTRRKITKHDNSRGIKTHILG
jgi:hypothetical protein